jgi:glycine/D-amino acid oxidase-like deaminating enzyme
MANEPLAQQLVVLRSLLDDVDARLTRAPAVPAGLEDLKRSVDTLRTNMWAILSAGQGALAPVRVERLKLRRAIEGIKAVRAGLTSPGGGTLHPEHVELQLIARDLADQIGKLR